MSIGDRDWPQIMGDIEGRPHCTCSGEGDQPWNPECVIHPVGHYYTEGCCDSIEEQHRHMTGDEFNARFPMVFDKKVTGPSGTTYRVEMRRYEDGLGLTLSIPMSDDDDSGLCLDLSGVDAAAVGALLIDAAAGDMRPL